ncbi:MAG: hypothetical protein WEB52_02040 [Dehalococcoidia bacterium]
MNIKTWCIAAVAAALVAAGGLVFASGAGAQDGDAAGGRTGIMARVAEKLGIGEEQLRSAFKDPQLDAVSEALANGRINEEQAANARERIEQGKPPLGVVRAHAVLQARRAIIESAAGALGITADELRAELRAGASIADVATERGVSIDDVKARIIADAEARLAALVADGRIDQAGADAALATLSERLDEIVTRARP